MGFDSVPGHPDSPVILHVPHASRVVTEHARARILLDDAELAEELDRMTDAHTDDIAGRAARAARIPPWTFRNLLSRLVVDPERFPDERERMSSVGMGAVYLRTSQGLPLREDDAAHLADLLALHYWPYAAAMSNLVASRLAHTGRAVILDIHSYPSAALPYELDPDRRPAICLGVDSFHTPDWLRAAAWSAFVGCGEIWVDSPFAGAYVPQAHYRVEREVSAIMIEIRRDRYLAEPGGKPHAGIDAVVTALTQLIDAASGSP
jgi:N-formylglutamate amidohydrolase